MKKTYIVIGVVAVALLLLLAFGFTRTPLGGTVHNVAEIFSNGIIIGDATKGGCIKIRNSSGNTWGYMYFDSALGTVTASTSVPFTGACGGL